MADLSDDLRGSGVSTISNASISDLLAKPTVDRRGNTRVLGLGGNEMEQIDEEKPDSARQKSATNQVSNAPNMEAEELFTNLSKKDNEEFRTSKDKPNQEDVEEQKQKPKKMTLGEELAQKAKELKPVEPIVVEEEKKDRPLTLAE